jgi:cytochrome c peroxidase
LDQFASTDGLPNAVGVGGRGKGLPRLQSGGAVVPRNTLPLWGRGGKGFTTFFWDGKVEQELSGAIQSQFGTEPPSSDPLTVAVHLPFVEIREMVVDDERISKEYMTEDVAGAQKIYELLTARVQGDSLLAQGIMMAFAIERQEITFRHIAESITDFIRDCFRVRETKFHRFVFQGEPLSAPEQAGGLIFYGKGRCALCHTGPYLSDLKFHAIPFPQAGFGKNGFGIDYGRYNVTFDDRDLYRFRTPPLVNVARTGPYSHSGSVISLEDAIRFHFDPLRFFDPTKHDLITRIELYKRLATWTGNEWFVPILDDNELKELVWFLKTLSFEASCSAQ